MGLGPVGLDSASTVGGVACDLGACDLGCDEVAIDAGTLAFFCARTVGTVRRLRAEPLTPSVGTPTPVLRPKPFGLRPVGER